MRKGRSPKVRLPPAVEAWMTQRGFSRQRVWQIRRQRLGQCIVCARQREQHALYCNTCAMKSRLRARKYRKNRLWKKGNRGRKPFLSE